MPEQVKKIDYFLSSSLPMTNINLLIQNSTHQKTPSYDLIKTEVAIQLPKKSLLLLNYKKFHVEAISILNSLEILGDYHQARREGGSRVCSPVA